MCGWMIQNHCTRSTIKSSKLRCGHKLVGEPQVYMPALPWNRKWNFSKMKWCQKFSWQQEVAALWKTYIALTLWRNMCKRWYGCSWQHMCCRTLKLQTLIREVSEWTHVCVTLQTKEWTCIIPRGLTFHSFTAAAHCRHAGVSYLIDMPSFECKGPMYLLHMKTRW